ncbi:pyridoxamine 5'-phosphate oxidase family protein [Salinicoccus hispanicus]|uniref:Pyridoxamine 5'-phosphate oxidase family protein n=1 Tax=Salinicoccus hispanicus TaxID=157225 RepID=A0A6N8TZ01_9STAP|nr:pyridoxamine 5'-phosphate oxidase family protein [Salinicoccus hispanicus]MXQ51228.1 pyridoxamine 5'-phosphate oxidase family protein [Salinicoccus hispanicus]
MNREDFKNTLKEILDNNKIGTLATIRDNKPISRYMYFYNDGLTLYTYTKKDTYKVEDLEENPNAHVLLGYEEREDLGERYVEIQGKASLPEEVTPDVDEMLAKLGNLYEKLKGEGDLQTIKIDIDTARIMNDDDKDPKTVEL